jgi:nucleoside-diphosphate-sugar epimerase
MLQWDPMTSDSNFFSNTSVLLTGCAGFIGSHLAETLLKMNAQVTGVDNLITGNKKNIEHLLQQYPTQFQVIEADVSQPAENYLPAQTKYDVVLHFASPASPPQYQAHPVETYLVNSVGTHYLLQYIKKFQPQARFLFASTSEVYGDPQVHPQTESYWGNVNPNGPRSCYDEAKRLGEAICGVHLRDFDLDVRIVRIFNTYGPRIDLEDGRVIPSFINSLLHQQPIAIFGDGSQTRSFCYVDDLVAGILSLASSDQGKGQTVNLGNPGEFTIKDAAELAMKLTGVQTSFEMKPLPTDDPTRRQPDISRAQQLLNWSPQISFEDGFKRTWDYFFQHQN